MLLQKDFVERSVIFVTISALTFYPKDGLQIVESLKSLRLTVFFGQILRNEFVNKKELSYQVYRLFPVFSDVFSMRRHQIFDSRFTEDVFLVAIERLELDDVSEIHLQKITSW